MAQMGASSMQRTRWNGLDAIVKTSPSAVELAFYQHTAPLLRAAGIHIPELISAEPNRLVIERIPHPVTLDEFHSCDIGLAQIAIDLAPLIPGMGEISAYSTLAQRYTCFNPDMDASALARHILLSKAWLVTEVVTLLHQRRNPMLNKYVTWYNQTLPDWFERIAGHL
ncbi:hypothetical protein ACVS4I_004594 [Vibrio fluvialis]